MAFFKPTGGHHGNHETSTNSIQQSRNIQQKMNATKLAELVTPMDRFSARSSFGGGSLITKPCPRLVSPVASDGLPPASWGAHSSLGWPLVEVQAPIHRDLVSQRVGHHQHFDAFHEHFATIDSALLNINLVKEISSGQLFRNTCQSLNLDSVG